LLAGRWNGESQRDALALGTLVNSRGLMELTLLNIGLERQIITPTLFTIFVFGTIVTTLMASPLFELVYRSGEYPLQRPSSRPMMGADAMLQEVQWNVR